MSQNTSSRKKDRFIPCREDIVDMKKGINGYLSLIFYVARERGSPSVLSGPKAAIRDKDTGLFFIFSKVTGINSRALWSSGYSSYFLCTPSKTRLQVTCIHT